MQLKFKNIPLYNTIAVFTMNVRNIDCIVYTRDISVKKIILSFQFIAINGELVFTPPPGCPKTPV